MTYQKYVYWMDEDRFFKIQADLEKRGLWEDKARKAVCLPLSPSIKIGWVQPDSWDKYDLCRRQMSWYRNSPHAGRVLIVSAFELDECGDCLETTIRRSAFKPRELPGRDEKLKLVASQIYRKTKPDAWDDIASEHPGKHDKWLKIMGLRNISFEELFITHCANHSNFIDPVYFIKDEKGLIPYSIDKTRYICSACMEFYNIIGVTFHKKLVVPCPGAVLFAGLPVNRYFEVVTAEKAHRS